MSTSTSNQSNVEPDSNDAAPNPKPSSATTLEEPYWAITRDASCDLYHESIVEAASAAEAETKAVAAFNIENGYGPNDDGGFEAVIAVSKSDLHRLIGEMEALNNHTR